MTLYAVSFYQIWYAKESRCYALLVYLSLGSVYCLLLYLENQNTLRFCGLVLFLTASLYTHNMVLFYLPGIAVMWLIYPGEMTIRARVRNALVVFSVVLLLYAPWLPTLGHQLQLIHTGFWVAAPSAKNLSDSLCVLLGFDPRTLQAIFRDRLHIHTMRLFGYWTWVAAIFMIFSLCVLGGLYPVRSADRRKLVALLGYSVLPVFLVFIYSRISTPIYIDRVFAGSCVLLPMVICAPIAFHVGNRKKVFQLIGLLVLLGTAASAVGYLRRTRKDDWRGVTRYLSNLPENPRLAVIVPDSCQALVHYYAPGLLESNPPIEVTGLLTKFDPPDFRSLQDDRNADDLSAMSNAVVSGRYKEVDVVLGPGPSQALVKSIAEYLTGHCASVEIVEFYDLEVKRCFLQSLSPVQDQDTKKKSELGARPGSPKNYIAPEVLDTKFSVFMQQLRAQGELASLGGRAHFQVLAKLICLNTTINHVLKHKHHFVITTHPSLFI
jgi:hypothetical protein